MRSCIENIFLHGKVNSKLKRRAKKVREHYFLKILSTPENTNFVQYTQTQDNVNVINFITKISARISYLVNGPRDVA